MTNIIKYFLLILLAVIVIGFILFLIGMEIYVWVVYGGKPVSELPSWVLFFMFGGK